MIPSISPVRCSKDDLHVALDDSSRAIVADSSFSCFSCAALVCSRHSPSAWRSSRPIDTNSRARSILLSASFRSSIVLVYNISY